MKKLLVALGVIFLTLPEMISSNAIGATNPWSVEKVILSDMGSEGETDTLLAKPLALNSGDEILQPYCFKVGAVSFIATVRLISDGSSEKPSYVTPLGLTSLDCSNTGLTATQTTNGTIYIFWIQPSLDQNDNTVSKIYTSQFVDTEEFVGWSNPINVATERIFISYAGFEELKTATNGNYVYVAAQYRDSMDNVPYIELISSSDGDQWSQPTKLNPEFGYSGVSLDSLFSGPNSSVFIGWHQYDSEDNLPNVSFFSKAESGTLGNAVELPELDSAAGFKRSSTHVSFWSVNDSSRLLRLVDIEAEDNSIDLPIFEQEFDSSDFGPQLDSPLQNDNIDIVFDGYRGTIWQRLDSNNSLRTIAIDDSSSSLNEVTYSFGGKPVFRRGSSWYQDAQLRTRESGKWISFGAPNRSDENYLVWFKNGNLGSINIQENNGGFKFQSLQFAVAPKLESPAKAFGTGKLNQYVYITSPEWLTYSALQVGSSVSWLTCTKAVTKPVFTQPSGCTPMRNSEGLEYLVKVTDRGKYIIPKLTATNSTSTSTVYLPGVRAAFK